MRETADSAQATEASTRGVIPRPASLATSPERLARMWALTPAERLEEARQGRLSLAEMLRWASRAPHEVPLVNNEFFFITALLADVADADEPTTAVPERS
jgi:hypothetical protein